MDKQSIYLHAFNLLPQFGPTRLSKLCAFFKTPEAAFTASQAQLVMAGIEPEIAAVFLQHKSSLDLAAEAEKLRKENINILCYLDSSYPQLLLQIPKFPTLLYYKGTMDVADELCVA